MKSVDVLIVDDDEPIIKALRRTLNMQGYSTIGTLDPFEAIRILQEQDIAILICDQRMPRMSGIEVLLRAREVSPNTVRILITAYSDIDVVISAINSGHIFHYIAKPWSENELLHVVEDAINYRKSALEKENIAKKVLKDSNDWKILITQLCVLIDQNMQNAVKALQKVVQVKDNDLLQHSIRVSQHAVRIAARMGLSDERRTNLEYASIFHDIGKIAIRDKILYKSDRLDDNEFTLMKSHPVYGAEILREFNFLDEVAEFVQQHHEKFDGSGYPRNLKGDEILLEAKIIAVADVYDALRSDRVYRKALPLEQIHKILQEESGTHFDPVVVNAFIEED